MFTPARRITTVLAVTLAAAAAAPAVSGAAPNQGSPSGQDNTELCSTLRDRLQRYHDLANDQTQPSRVRAFYRARAQSTLFRAQMAGCDWAPAAALSGRGDRGAVTSARRSAKRAPGGQTTRPGTATKVMAIKAAQTGNQQHDQYCADVAKLIDEAIAEGDRELGLGNDAEAQAWWDLAEDFIDRATQNGCRFTLQLKSRARLVHAAPKVVATRS